MDANLFVKKAVQTEVKNDEISSVLFADYAIDDKLKRNIADRGFTTPTPIQEKTIPYLLEGRDVIGIANTGTGKTAAFLIPLIDKAYKNRDERILIITPTRELALQIVDEFRELEKGMGLDAALCIGGANIQRQEKKLWQKPHFVIGTPGRLKDFINRRKLDLSLFRSIVLDEVDRMVDIGFLKDVQFIVSQLPQKRHSLFFSATVSDKAKSIMQGFVNNPVTVSVKQQATSENVDQDIIRVPGHQKIEKLHELLTTDGFDKVLIFGRTKWGIEKLMTALMDRGFKAAAIHGNKTQGQRQRALEQFKQDEVKILLATDVASRGLDIQNVTHVINYDAPESYDDYVHRIGRTGRADKKGTALTFVE
ncbi:DEAD/DEAH box helicase [Candidatus Gottesmanbacteria bacterium]|nr:DEAD/DEAH box helicase [Candidatus Gottesmanbacteria bacterium]